MQEMEKYPMGEEEVKDILRHRERKIQVIHDKMISLYRDLEDPEELLASIRLPSMKYSGMPGGTKNRKDLGDQLFQYHNRVWKWNEEIRKMMYVLVQEEDRITRVWACYHALEDPYYSILRKLYVEGQLYQAVEKEVAMSHRIFEENRQNAVVQVIQFYKSEKSVSDLMCQHIPTIKKKGKGRRKGKDSKGYEQISMEKLIAEGYGSGPGRCMGISAAAR